MTTQNVGSSDVKGFDPEEAERLASLIRPAWEDDEVGLLGDEPPAPAVAIEAAPAAPAQADAKAFEAAVEEKTVVAPPPAPSAGASKATDTMVDSRPPFSDAARPQAAGPTMLGLGSEDAAEPAKAPIAAAAAALSKELQAFDSSPPEKAASGDGVNKSFTRTAHLEATPLQASSPTSTRSRANQRPSASRADDPVELPVRKSSTGLMLGLGGAAVVLLGLGAYALFGSSGDKQPDPATPVKAATEKPAEAKPTATSKPTATAATPATAVAATATATVTATATATATVAATAAPTLSQTAPTAVTKTTAASPGPTATTKPTGQKPPPQNTGKPGGIIRDVPF
jgi:hypothetical protein